MKVDIDYRFQTIQINSAWSMSLTVQRGCNRARARSRATQTSRTSVGYGWSSPLQKIHVFFRLVYLDPTGQPLNPGITLSTFW